MKSDQFYFIIIWSSLIVIFSQLLLIIIWNSLTVKQYMPALLQIHKIMIFYVLKNEGLFLSQFVHSYAMCHRCTDFIHVKYLFFGVIFCFKHAVFFWK